MRARNTPSRLSTALPSDPRDVAARQASSGPHRRSCRTSRATSATSPGSTRLRRSPDFLAPSSLSLTASLSKRSIALRARYLRESDWKRHVCPGRSPYPAPLPDRRPASRMNPSTAPQYSRSNRIAGKSLWSVWNST